MIKCSLIILCHSECILLATIILFLHQKALKCTYGPNTIKLNASYFCRNLISKHISMTTEKHVFTVTVCWAAIIWKSYITEGKAQIEWISTCGARWKRKTWPDRLAAETSWWPRIVTNHFTHTHCLLSFCLLILVWIFVVSSLMTEQYKRSLTLQLTELYLSKQTRMRVHLPCSYQYLVN